MRKHRIILFTLLATASLSLSGCSYLFSLFNKTADPIDLAPTQLSGTYNDYMNHNFYQLDGTPLSGSSKLLVVPIWFTDSDTYISNDKKETVRQDIQKAYFGTDSDVGWKSVKTYYKELSQNKLNLTGEVTSWYECGQSSNQYWSEDQGAQNTISLVKTVVNQYKSAHSSSMSDYDTDQNGYIDGVVLIYGAPDYGALKNNNASNLWAYCFWTQQDRGTPSNPVPNAFFWASYDFLYKPGQMGVYGSGDTNHCNLDTHTFIHEMGHMLGLEDYYDYSGQYIPSGGFSMQDYNVGSHDPYSVMAFGWASPMIPKESCTLKLRSFQETHDLILLAASPSKVVSPFDEYLLLELYTPSGLNSFDTNYAYLGQYPTGPKSPGIRLWHVDGRLLQSTTRDGDLKVTFANSINSNYYYTHAMSNTYYDESVVDYVSPLGKDYADYNILQLIRNDTKDTYHPTYTLSQDDLFMAGDTFKIKNYKKQFVEGERFNDGSGISWSFKVNKVNSSEAIVTVTKG